MCLCYIWCCFYMNELCRINKWDIHERVTSHTCMSHDAHINESCGTCELMRFAPTVHMGLLLHERVATHIWMSHVTYMHKSCHVHEWVMSGVWMSHVRYMTESWTRVWMSLVTYMNELKHMYDWILSRTPIYTRDMTNAFICASHNRKLSRMSHVSHIHASRHICEGVILMSRAT